MVENPPTNFHTHTIGICRRLVGIYRKRSWVRASIKDGLNSELGVAHHVPLMHEETQHKIADTEASFIHRWPQQKMVFIAIGGHNHTTLMVKNEDTRFNDLHSSAVKLKRECARLLVEVAKVRVNIEEPSKYRSSKETPVTKSMEYTMQGRNHSMALKEGEMGEL